MLSNHVLVDRCETRAFLIAFVLGLPIIDSIRPIAVNQLGFPWSLRSASIGSRFLDFALLPQLRHNGVRREKRALYLPVRHCSDTRTQRYPHDFEIYTCDRSGQKSGGGKPRGRVQVKNRSRNDDQPEAGRCKCLI